MRFPYLSILPELHIFVLLVNAKGPAVAADGSPRHEALVQLQLRLGLEDARVRPRRAAVGVGLVHASHGARLAAVPAGAAVLVVLSRCRLPKEGSGKSENAK